MRDLTVEEIDQVGGGAAWLAAPLVGGVVTSGAYALASVANGTSMSTSGFASAFVGGATTFGLGAIGGTLKGLAGAARVLHSTSVGTVAGSAAGHIVTGTGGEGEASTLHRLEK